MLQIRVLFDSKRKKKIENNLLPCNGTDCPVADISTSGQYISGLKEIINITLSPARCLFSTSIDRASPSTSSATMRRGLRFYIDQLPV